MSFDGPVINDPWTLSPSDHSLVLEKGKANRLRFAVTLLFFRLRGRFPVGPMEIEDAVIENVARQLGQNF
jgi:hypothetical protein